MKQNAFTVEQNQPAESFDLCRISKAKLVCDVASNTIRAYARAGGIKIYKAGKSTFFSKSELAAFIRKGAVQS
jgi:hypothetical protein